MGHARHMPPVLLVVLLQGLWSIPGAWAQSDGPLPLPKADVTVDYHFDNTPFGAPKRLRIAYAKGGSLVRVDVFRWDEAKNPSKWIIFDRSKDRLITVEAESRVYTESSIGKSPNPGSLLAADTRYSRLGTDSVAHSPCTNWKVEASGKPNDQDVACVTDDGVVLRLASKKPGVASMTAVNIHYGTPPDDLFDTPEGFKREPVP